MTPRPLGWLGILRLGLLQTALGAILVLTTSTLNRVMVVEYAMPAAVPGLLVALHHACQALRPRWGYASDRGGRRTPWIVGGMAVLAAGGLLAAIATAWMATAPVAGLVLAVAAFVLIGLGVGAAGTNTLILLAERVEDERRAPAATIVWVMMIAGFIVTAALGGRALDPYSPERLIAVAAVVGLLAFLLSVVAVSGLEGSRRAGAAGAASSRSERDGGFSAMLRMVWCDPVARRFTLFIFASMLAYSAQDLILEPYAGIVFGMTPGETTRLGGLQNAGVLAGMVTVGLAGHLAGRRPGFVGAMMIAGCVASAAALAAIAESPALGLPIRPLVAALGFANGAFAVAAISMMMDLAGSGPQQSRGTRMGLWGAAQAIAFGAGGLAGTVAVDAVRWATGLTVTAYQAVFLAEAVMFLASALLALAIVARPSTDRTALGAGERITPAE
ncbi:BCD family MFS transporter [Prosthecomicrobium hirschii]|uniref:BCD family MFS transporter n=1 Tax=Prosthecodimorpha hirschii TaxID=665126 RepID=UPI00221F024B|nr:BCD family MFS transporter [Prosthecomicrobium hirschii]MCW1842478.1 BCD family MFS transporter [Prosthecomicrobium hirschii]